MKFVIDKREIPEFVVDLTLEKATGDRIFLCANGKAIMGFKNGMFCRYSNAGDVCGLVVNQGMSKFIMESPNVF